MLGSLYSSFLGCKPTEKERKQRPEEMKNKRPLNIEEDSYHEHLLKKMKRESQIQEGKEKKILIYDKKEEEGEMFFDPKILRLRKEFKEKSEYLTEESKIENDTHKSAMKRLKKKHELELERLDKEYVLKKERSIKEIELELERDKKRHEMEMARLEEKFELVEREKNRNEMKMEEIENERKKMMKNLDNIMKWIYDKKKYEIDYDIGNVRDIKLKIKDLVKKREMNEKEIGSKKGKIGHFEKKTKIDIRKYKSQLKYKYKNDGIEFLRKYRIIEKEIELRDQRSENEKLNLQKEIKGNESNGDKENKELNIKIVPKEEQLNTQNLQIVLKNIIKNFLLQLKDKHSGDLGKIDNDANTTMNQGKNKIKMIDKMNFNKDESLHNADAGTSVIARHDSKIPFPFQVNQSNNDNQLNSIMQRNNRLNYNNQTSKMDQNLNNESKFINISMNMKVNQKINDLYKYNPKYYYYDLPNK